MPPSVPNTHPDPPRTVSSSSIMTSSDRVGKCTVWIGMLGKDFLESLKLTHPRETAGICLESVEAQVEEVHWDALRMCWENVLK